MGSLDEADVPGWLHDFITADPSAVLSRGQVYDGEAIVIEADVGGRYRYVARNPGELSDDMVERMASAFRHIADLRTRGFPRFEPC